LTCKYFEVLYFNSQRKLIFPTAQLPSAVAFFSELSYVLLCLIVVDIPMIVTWNVTMNLTLIVSPNCWSRMACSCVHRQQLTTMAAGSTSWQLVVIKSVPSLKSLLIQDSRTSVWLYRYSHLYADDTPLLLSFLALHFSHNITELENTIVNVSNWMSSKFLSLNPFKAEFLIFGLPQQVSKLNYPTIHLPNNVIHIHSPIDSAHNLGVSFDINLSF